MSQEAKPAPRMVTEPWDDSLSVLIQTQSGESPLQLESFRGQHIVTAPLNRYRDVAGFLERQGFTYLVDLTAVDRHPARPRFELVAILYSFEANRRVRLKTALEDGEEAPTLSGLYVAANWAEREVFDMFGIRFAGHPNLKRILMPEDWEGHPLRRDQSIVAMDNAWVRKHLGIESGQ
jgi:NADH-quinone oxidoreductase subunit C